MPSQCPESHSASLHGKNDINIIAEKNRDQDFCEKQATNTQSSPVSHEINAETRTTQQSIPLKEGKTSSRGRHIKAPELFADSAHSTGGKGKRGILAVEDECESNNEKQCETEYNETGTSNSDSGPPRQKLRSGKENVKKPINAKNKGKTRSGNRCNADAETKKESKHHRDKVKILEQRNAELERNIGRLQLVFRKQQDEILKADTATCPPDNEIRDGFKALQDLWGKWAKTYACESLHSLEKSALKTAVAIGRNASDHNSEDFFNKSLIAARAGPRILLTASVAHNICSEIFESPFFLLGEFVEMKFMDNTREVLEWALEQGIKCNEKEGNLWRNQTLKILQPCLNNIRAQMRIKNGAECVAFYQNLCSLLLDYAEKLIRPLRIEERRRMRSELYDICKTAGDLACRISFTKARMEVVRHDLNNRPFQCDSDTIEAHKSMLLDVDDTRYNGRNIEFVCEPLIQAWGNEEGEHYDQSKVWAKGIVWFPETAMDESSPQSEEPIATQAQNELIQQQFGQGTQGSSIDHAEQSTPQSLTDKILSTCPRVFDGCNNIMSAFESAKNLSSGTWQACARPLGTCLEHCSAMDVKDMENVSTTSENTSLVIDQRSDKRFVKEVDSHNEIEKAQGQDQDTPVLERAGGGPEIPMQAAPESSRKESEKLETPDTECERAPNDEPKDSQIADDIKESSGRTTQLPEQVQDSEMPAGSGEGEDRVRQPQENPNETETTQSESRDIEMGGA